MPFYKNKQNHKISYKSLKGKGLGIIGGGTALIGGAAQAGTAETTEGKIAGIVTSAIGGALTGLAFGGIPGAIAGGLGGLALGGVSAFAGRQFGGAMDEGKTYLVGESGPEMVTSGTTGTVTANQDLKETFDTTALETKMASMVTELNSANKTLTSMVNGVNTLVAVESRALKAVETSARKDRNQVGLV